jgi:hypothetical protein
VAAARGADAVKQRSVAVLARVVFGMFVAMTAGSVVLSAATPGEGDSPLVLTLIILAFLGIGGVGVVIAVRMQRNAIGWLLLAIVGGTAAGNFGQAYGAFGARTGPGTLPGGLYAAWLGSAAWPVSIGLVLFVLLLFPDGKPQSRRWRPVVWVTGVGLALVALSFLFKPGDLEVDRHIQNPFGLKWAGGLVSFLGGFGAAVLFVCFLLAVLSVIVRFRRSRGEQRQQLKWFTYGAALILVALLTGGLWSAVVPDWASGLPFLLGLLSLPVTIGTAILRYRLYDIDRIINRTLVYGLLTGVLAGVYVALAVGVGSLAGQQNSLVIAGSTLVVAALFGPARRLIQQTIDRRFYRRKYDAVRTLQSFTARLRDEVDLDELRAHLEAVVHETMQPAQASLWLRGPSA